MNFNFLLKVKVMEYSEFKPLKQRPVVQQQPKPEKNLFKSIKKFFSRKQVNYTVEEPVQEHTVIEEIIIY